MIRNYEDLTVTDSNALPIFKLHGSVNWFEHPKGITVDESENTVEHNGQYFQVPSVRELTTKSDRIPLLIPPSFLKPELDGYLSKVWADAATELYAADVVVFIGYSFPETDTEMAYFFATSLYRNVRLRKIVVIDPCAENIVKRLTSGRYGSYFRDFLETIGLAWEKLPSPLVYK